MNTENQREHDPRAGENKPRKLWAFLVAAASVCGAGYYAKKEQHEINETALVYWTKWLARGTWAAVVVAAGAAGLLLIQLGDNRDAMVEANRAWLAVPDVAFYTKPQVGQPLGYLLLQRNFGRGPANHVTLAAIDNGFLDRKSSTDVGNSNFSAVDMCAGVAVQRTGTTLFPNTTPSKGPDGLPVQPFMPERSDLVRQGIFATKEFLAGSQIFYVRGCFIYETMGIVGKTRFCSLMKLSTDVTGLVTQGEYCPRGAFAE